VRHGLLSRAERGHRRPPPGNQRGPSSVATSSSGSSASYRSPLRLRNTRGPLSSMRGNGCGPARSSWGESGRGRADRARRTGTVVVARGRSLRDAVSPRLAGEERRGETAPASRREGTSACSRPGLAATCRAGGAGSTGRVPQARVAWLAWGRWGGGPDRDDRGRLQPASDGWSSTRLAGCAGRARRRAGLALARR
jgi:hypothetical protein